MQVFIVEIIVPNVVTEADIRYLVNGALQKLAREKSGDLEEARKLDYHSFACVKGHYELKRQDL